MAARQYAEHTAATKLQAAALAVSVRRALVTAGRLMPPATYLRSVRCWPRTRLHAVTFFVFNRTTHQSVPFLPMPPAARGEARARKKATSAKQARENKQLKQHDKRDEFTSIHEHGDVLWQLPAGEAGQRAYSEIMQHGLRAAVAATKARAARVCAAREARGAVVSVASRCGARVCAV